MSKYGRHLCPKCRGKDALEFDMINVKTIILGTNNCDHCQGRGYFNVEYYEKNGSIFFKIIRDGDCYISNRLQEDYNI